MTRQTLNEDNSPSLFTQKFNRAALNEVCLFTSTFNIMAVSVYLVGDAVSVLYIEWGREYLDILLKVCTVKPV